MNPLEELAPPQSDAISAEDASNLAREKAVKQRRIQALNLNRARISEQIERSGSERYQQLLQQELAHIDRQLAELV